MRERSFPAVVPAVAEAVGWVRARADEEQVPSERSLDVELAVEEALMNVCLHAYGGGGGELSVRAGRTGEGFVVEVEDAGPPFDPTSAPMPDTSAPLEERPVGGLGVLLVRRVTDLVRWRREDGRNVLTLVFSARGAGTPAPPGSP